MVNAGGTLVLALVLIIIISQTTLYFSRKKLFVPLKRLEESATAIADGDLNAEIDTLQPGELGSLARATDDMRESVRHLIKDLKEANTRLEDHKNSLENTVKIRTDELKRKNVSLNQALEDVQNAKKGAEVANLAKSRFLASMSHEIRTPMNAILGMADILWETPLTEDQARYVQVFRTAGESLLEILDDILDLSKIEAGHLTLEKTIFSLDEVLGKACTIIEPQAEDKGLAFAYSIAPGIPDRLEGDPTRLKQILINLLGNAIKFTKSGTVQMAVEQAPGHNGVATLQFSVEDTGIGIPADKLSTIFDSFTQADSSTTRQFGGTGLGLAISMQLVRMMGGRIWAESSLGSGSTFHFTTRFGIVNKSGPTPPENTVHFDSQQNVPGLNILMVEDSKYNAFVIQTYLKSTLCQLTIVENGLDGFEEFKKGDFDCILMDIQMPVMDGYETTRAIRAWEQANGLDSIFIVAMTAYALTGDSEKCIQAGADFHLPKPVKKSRLFEILTGLDQKRHTPTASTKATTPPSNMKLAELKEAIIATYTAIDQKDLATVEALGNTFRQMGTDRSMDTLKEYGDALLQAAKEGAKPDRIRQILTVLSEYVERMDTL